MAKRYIQCSAAIEENQSNKEKPYLESGLGRGLEISKKVAEILNTQNTWVAAL
jgi:hypothetical protein